MFVTVRQPPQSEITLYCGMLQLFDTTELQLNVSFPDWASARWISSGGGFVAKIIRTQ